MAAHQYLDASTAYVTEGDMRAIEQGLHPGPNIQYGAWLYVPSDPTPVEARQQDLSPAFWALLDYARAKGCRWINLDSDGDNDLELPTHEW